MRDASHQAAGLASVSAADGAAPWRLSFEHALTGPNFSFSRMGFCSRGRGDQRLFHVDVRTGELLGELDN